MMAAKLSDYQVLIIALYVLALVWAGSSVFTLPFLLLNADKKTFFSLLN